MSKKNKQTMNKNLKYNNRQLGGAIYTFDLNDKIGGLPAYKPLNGTQDGDCPATDTLDLGFTNYGVTRGGGARRRNRRSPKNNRKLTRKTRRRGGSRSNSRQRKPRS